MHGAFIDSSSVTQMERVRQRLLRWLLVLSRIAVAEVRLQFSDGLCCVTANGSRARLRMDSDEKDGMCNSIPITPMSLPSLSNFPAPASGAGMGPK